MPEVVKDLRIRRLQPEDYHRGYLEVLKELTTVGNIEYEQFRKQCKQVPEIYVISNETDNIIIGTATLLIEAKIIHDCGFVGHIEDVVVSKKYRSYGLGAQLIEYLVDRAKETGCYKVILDCAEHNLGFYHKCGFMQKEIQMVQYLDTKH